MELDRRLKTGQHQTSGRAIPIVLAGRNVIINIISMSQEIPIYKIQGLKLRPKKHNARSIHLSALLLIWHIIPSLNPWKNGSLKSI